MTKAKTKKKPAAKTKSKAVSAAKPKVTVAAKTPKAKKEKAAKEVRVTKSSIILDALKRPNGATIDELAKAASWQNHSVRGFISTLGKKGTKIEKFTRNGDGKTAYKLEQPGAANDE